jgi:ADP-heptose:LPS heptosyltransferase
VAANLPSRILIIRLSAIGDVLFTLPAVNALQGAFPGAGITFLVYKEFASILKGFASVNSVMTLDRKRFKSGIPGAMLSELSGLLRGLKHGRFDLVVDLHGFGETGFFSWWTGAPQRWGLVYKKIRGWAYTRRSGPNPGLHPIDHNLAILTQAGGLPARPARNELMLPNEEMAQARKLFEEHKLDPAKPSLFIQPFTAHAHKNWSLDKFLELARLWKSRGTQVIFGGGPADRLALEPMAQAGFVVTAGAPLLVSAGLVALSSVIVGGDTGLLHMAVALRKRVVMLMPPPSVTTTTYPYGHREWALNPPEGKETTAISVEVVDQACARAFAEVQNG